ncbi:type IV pilin protein [Spartinivicinus ruber]|uniref:type IV pilin protein n=1 Tax=Spartinivicinus ruber TaxID=2683272 RepID=UPI0013D7107D|nr:type IV pilin protein [Spartinivicinus ruber]
MQKRSQGFTLVELMIVVVIVAILAAVAIPSYQEYVQKSRRADAQSELMKFAQAVERHYAKQYNYKTAEAKDNRPAPGVYVKEAPKDGDKKYYDLYIYVNKKGDGYNLRAVPKADSPQKGDGALTLTSSNETCWYKDQDTIPDDNSGCIRWKS